MKILSIFATLFICLNLEAKLVHESSIALSGHNPEKWGLKHIKTHLGEGYFKFNELLEVKTTTSKISKKRFNENMGLIRKLESDLAKQSESNTAICSRKLIVQSKQNKNSISNTYCLDKLPDQELATVSKTIQKLKN